MPSCTCSTRALQLFIADFTGLRLRQSRPQSFFHQRPRYAPFGTRPVLRQLESAATRENGIESVRLDSTGQVLDGAPEMETMKETEETFEEALEEDWHADTETVVQTNDSVETVAALEMATPMDQIEEADNITTLKPLGPRAKRDLTAKEQSRLRRKERRQESGKWKPSTREPEEGEAAQMRISNALKKIKELEGPALEERKPKVAKPRKESRVSPPKPPPEERPRPRKEPWQIQKAALTTKFGPTGWQPRKRISPDMLEGIRALHSSDPAAYGTETLAKHFEISPEAIRRILKSKWRPSEDVVEDRRVRWEKRGVRKWSEMAEQGARPPARWRALGVKSAKGREREERTVKGGEGGGG